MAAARGGLSLVEVASGPEVLAMWVHVPVQSRGESRLRVGAQGWADPSSLCLTNGRREVPGPAYAWGFRTSGVISKSPQQGDVALSSDIPEPPLQEKLGLWVSSSCSSKLRGGDLCR